MPMRPDDILKPIVLQKQKYTSDDSSWHGPIPIAFWCVDVLRPKAFVELGTHKGDSYLAFCQAVKELGLTTSCFAVDTWLGDEQSGYYDDEVFIILQRYHEEHYTAFSRLVRSTFDDALEQFTDKSVDLLNIGGLHSYEAVKHDFESWLPKLSDSGVVLFHGINANENGFGVWQLWDELCQQYPNFTFLHNQGLGILTVGPKAGKSFNKLFDLSEKEARQVQEIFVRLGLSVNASNHRAAHDRRVAEGQKRIAAFEDQGLKQGNWIESLQSKSKNQRQIPDLILAEHDPKTAGRDGQNRLFQDEFESGFESRT